MAEHYFEVDGNGMKRVIGDTFSKNTWITELSQNSLRAGATEIHFEYDEDTHVLVFCDDGRGFHSDDWSSYFTIASSGWSESIKAQERPFGIGCASLLFAASEVVITSNGKHAIINTDLFLGGYPVSVLDVSGDVEQKKGAIFRIALMADVKFDVELVKRTLQGFCIPVYVNGEAIERPYFEGNYPNSVEFEFGRIAVQSLTGRDRNFWGVPGTNALLFISGLRCEAQAYLGCDRNVVHLDPAKVRSRVPDRAELVGNRDAVVSAIELSIKQAYARELATLKNRLSQSEFINTYWYEAKSYAAHLLLDMPVPGFLFRTVDTVAHARLDGAEDANFCPVSDDVSLADFSGDAPLQVFDFRPELGRFDCALNGDNCVEENFNILNYLYLSRLSFIDSSDLPDGHWIEPHLISFDDNATFNVVHNGRAEVLNTEGFWRAEGVICDEFSVSVIGARSAAEDVVLESATSREDALYFDGTVYFPANMISSTGICRQCVEVIFTHSEWDDSEYIDEEYLEKVESQLDSWLHVQRGGGLSELVAKFIDDHQQELAIFGGNALPSLKVSFKLEDNKDNSAGGNTIKINVQEIAA